MSLFQENSERLVDPLDIGARAGARFVEHAVAAAQQRANPAPPVDFDGENCACGTPIPEKRLEAGRYNCIDCQRAKEHNNKLRGLPSWAA